MMAEDAHSVMNFSQQEAGYAVFLDPPRTSNWPLDPQVGLVKSLSKV
jgi:hypothetical protein